MPSEQNRVYIENEDEAPSDAIIRESDNGNLYYRPADRGRGSHVGGSKDNQLLESGGELTDKQTIGKPFEGPQGQGPFDSFEDCTLQMEDSVSDPEGWCAWAHNEDTGEWPSEKYAKQVPDEAIYLPPGEDAPEGARTVEGPQGATYYIPEGADQQGGGQSYEEAQESMSEELPGGHTPRDVATSMAQEAFREMEGGAWELHDAEEVSDILEDQVREQAERMMETEEEQEIFVDEAMMQFEDMLAAQEMGEPVATSASKIYVGYEEEAPDDVEVKEDDVGTFYRQEAWDQARAFYPGETRDEHEEETEVNFPDAEMPTDEGVESEEDEDEERQDLREQARELLHVES